MRVLCQDRELENFPDILRPFCDDLVIDFAADYRLIIQCAPSRLVLAQGYAEELAHRFWSTLIAVDYMDPNRSSYLIVDNGDGVPFGAFATNDVTVGRLPGGSAGLEAVTMHFDSLWAKPEKLDYQSSIVLASPEKDVAVVSAGRWHALYERILGDPSILQGLSPRAFEEFVADLLVADGMVVELTQSSRDGGRDIFASAETTLGNQLYLVECKRYAPGNPVGVKIVRELYGVVEDDRATGGIVVTTSRFTEDAVKMAQRVKHRMALRDRDGLIAWIRRVTLPGS